jgi:hypothetical protein
VLRREGQKIAVPGKQHYVVEILRNLERIDCEFNSNIALVFPPALNTPQPDQEKPTVRKVTIHGFQSAPTATGEPLI